MESKNILKESYESITDSNVFNVILEDVDPDVVLKSYQDGDIKLNKQQIIRLINRFKYSDVNIGYSYIVLNTGKTGKLQYDTVQRDMKDYDITSYSNFISTFPDELHNYNNKNKTDVKLLFTYDNEFGNGLSLHEYDGENKWFPSASEEFERLYRNNYGDYKSFDYFDSSNEGIDIFENIKARYQNQPFDKKTKQEVNELIEILKEKGLYQSGIIVFRGDKKFYRDVVYHFLSNDYQDGMDYFQGKYDEYTTWFKGSIIKEQILQSPETQILYVETTRE